MVVIPVLLAIALGIDAWSTAKAHEQDKEAMETELALDTSSAELLQRYEIKHAMIRELIAGHATLAEVTHEFIRLNQARPQCMEVIRRSFPGTTDEEKMARNVLGFVETSLELDREIDRSAVRARLDTELAAMLESLSGSTAE